jgi:hypothetical protein
MRKRIPEGIRRRMIRSRGVPEEVRRLRNLAENLGRRAGESVCDLVDIRTEEYKWG